VVTRVASIGMSLDTGTVPGAPKENRIADGEAELGLGIHGEPGIEKVRFDGAGAAVRLVIDRLRPHVDGRARHAVLLNNLGGCTPLEMAVLAEELCRSELAPSLGWMLGPAPLMTSLDMRGFSVSLLPVEAGEEELLAAPTGCAAWPPLRTLAAPEVRPLPEAMAPQRFQPSADPAMRELLEQCCTLLVAQEADLNALDARTGD